ncbi:hypothetical protein QEN19_000063 [Hanseniaspora menglaensis]
MVSAINQSTKRGLENGTNDDLHAAKRLKVDEDELNESVDEEEDEDEGSDEKLNTKNVTAKDMQVAKETAELFKSNIFKLQIDELLANVILPEKHILKMEKFLHKLYDLLQDVPEWGSEKTLAEVEDFFHDKTTAIPFCDPKPLAHNTNYKFGFLKPNAVSLVGSFALKSAIFQPNGSSIDVAVEIPESLIEKKDFLNYRIIHKRSVYLAFLSHHLNILLEENKLSRFIKLDYTYKNNDTLQPVLNISAIKEDSDMKKDKLSSQFNFYKTKFSINILITYPENVFDNKKLLPHKNSIRISKSSEQEDESVVPTSIYNFSVLSNCYQNHYLKYLHRTKKTTESFKDAMILARIWLSQRGFNSDIGVGFGTFEFSILMAALLNGGGATGNKILLHGFSSYQLFKTTVKYISTMDLSEKGYLHFNSDTGSETNGTTSTKYATDVGENGGFNNPTLLDKFTKVNIFGKMTLQSYKMLKLYSQHTLVSLNDQVKDQFEGIFLNNLVKNQLLKFDLIVDLDLSNSLNILQEKFDSKEKITSLNFENFLIKYVGDIVSKSMGERVKSFEVELISNAVDVGKNFSITKRRFSKKFSGCKIKFVLDLNESEKLVTKGPAKDEINEENKTKIFDFKKFWGSKASLRRFKDGSIVYSCVWSNSSSHSVILTILKYILQQHLGETCKISNFKELTALQDLIKLPNVPGAKAQNITNLSNYFNLKKSFDELYKIIFQMTDLPLSVRNVQPIGTGFRYTSMLQPVPFGYSNPDFLQDVIIEFESSSKWPDEIASLEKAKAAFMLKIHDNIVENHSEYKVTFSRDENIPLNLEVITMNVYTPEGYGFRFRVLTERDEVLYLRAINNCRNDLKKELENTFLKFIQLYKNSVTHTRTIEMLSHSYPMYSPSCRLFKQWLDSHLLFSHLPEELIELIAMQPFVEQSSYFQPGSVQNGFLKILKFLSKWNWLEEPLILDLIKPEDQDSEAHGTEKEEKEDSNDDSEISEFTLKKLSEKLTVVQYKEFQSNFEETRKANPTGLNFQFFVASRVDPTGILYSSDISLSIATRLTALSKIAMNLISQHGVNERTMELLFSPGLKDYDFVVTIAIPENLSSSSGILGKFKNIDSMITKFPEDISDITNLMDPTYQLVKYLNKKYGSHIVFSYQKYITLNNKNKNVGDDLSYNVITGLVKPLLKDEKLVKFRVNMDADVLPVDENNVKLNLDAILAEISNFGFDIIDTVTKN